MAKKQKHGLGPMIARKAAANAERLTIGARVKVQIGPSHVAPGSRLKKPKGKGS